MRERKKENIEKKLLKKRERTKNTQRPSLKLSRPQGNVFSQSPSFLCEAFWFQQMENLKKKHMPRELLLLLLLCSLLWGKEAANFLGEMGG